MAQGLASRLGNTSMFQVLNIPKAESTLPILGECSSAHRDSCQLLLATY